MPMSKQARFHAAVTGAPLDRPPATAWVHFQSDHLDPHRVADLHEQFAHAYDWDVTKVMNDYRYPVPAGVTSLREKSILRLYARLPLSEPCFEKQLRCLAILRERLGPAHPIVETVFEPWQQIVRNIGWGEAARLFEHEDAALEALQRVTETTCEYVGEVRKLGIDGIFIAINGAIPADLPRGATDQQHERFQQPFTSQVLRAAEGLVRILHVHGSRLVIERARSYPCEVISVSDRLPGNPSLTQLRAWTDKCLMGGIDETRFAERTLDEIRQELEDCIAQAGKERLILAPGCTLPSFTSQRNLAYLRECSIRLFA